MLEVLLTLLLVGACMASWLTYWEHLAQRVSVAKERALGHLHARSFIEKLIASENLMEHEETFAQGPFTFHVHVHPTSLKRFFAIIVEVKGAQSSFVLNTGVCL